MSERFRILRHAEAQPHLAWLNKLALEEERRYESLGFIPLQAYERDCHLGRIWIAELEGEPIGFIYAGALTPNKDARIHQAVIDFDLRRRLYGALMVGELLQASRDAGCNGVSLHCGFDLEANAFWESMGFYVSSYKEGGLRRARILNVWRTDFADFLIPHPHLIPARGERDATLWRKHKDSLTLTDNVRSAAGWSQLAPILAGETL